ncbi:MAG: Asp-tRNA(Asn)/Glu-tRNA(Gln) amidotransferase subunit GatC [Desulfovibrio sp.]
MKLTKDDVAKIATLARLDLSDEKQELFAGQLESILQYMDKLNEVDTEGVEPMYSPVDQVSVMREDVVVKEYTREEVLSNAPEGDGEFFIVPRIV